MATQTYFSVLKVLALPILSLLTGYLTLPVQAQPAEMEEFLHQIEEDTEALRQFNQSMETVLQEMQAFEEEMEASGFSDAFDRYQSNLISCSPIVLNDFPLPGAAETIRGWDGDRCRVDTRMTLEEETIVSSCLYTQRDIELITGPELYLPDDLDRTCQRLK
ncbi:MAG: hypothetical protein AAF703_18730 [Cyanobacteria bacterium P01_D01_bin.105]